MGIIEEHEDMDEFEKKYSVGHIMSAINAVPDGKSIHEYLNFNFHACYLLNQCDQFSRVNVNVDYNKGIIEIHIPGGITLGRPFELYKAINCKGNDDLAKNWRNDTLLQNAKLVEQQQAVSVNNATQMPYYPNYAQMNPTTVVQNPVNQFSVTDFHNQYYASRADQALQRNSEFSKYIYYPPPKIDINAILDSKKKKRKIDLQLCMSGPKFFAWDLAHDISKKTDMPFASVMMVILGAFSGYTTKFWNCAYELEGISPISLYICVEHGSGTKKTKILSLLLSPLNEMLQKQMDTLIDKIKDHNTKTNILEIEKRKSVDKYEKAEIRAEIHKIKIELEGLEDRLKVIKGLTPVTNATPEALEKVLCETNGHFFAASSEKGLLNSLLGMTYSKKHQNHDMLLNGRDGGIVNVERVGRQAYYGPVVGSILEFAQEDNITKIIEAANNSGLAERFCFISEPDNIGNRDHSKEEQFNESLVQIYLRRVQFFNKLIEVKNLSIHSKELDHKSRINLKISKKAWQHIYQFQNELEYQLTENGELSHPIFKGMVGKIRLQVMSIASNLYLLDLDNPPLTQEDPLILIPDEYVSTSTQMFKSIIYHNLEFLQTYGVITDNDQIATAYEYFVGREDKWFSMQNLKKALSQVKPFKLLKEPRLGVQNAILFLAENDIILKNSDNTEFKFNPSKYSPI
jgi:hypothetical protein